MEKQIKTQRETCDWVEIPHKLNQGSIKSKNSREVMHYVATLDSCIVSSDIILFAQIAAEYEHVSNISKSQPNFKIKTNINIWTKSENK